ncbi:MAG: SIMPL domain-containing protein [Candidatus Woesearchaeota archaeon]
MKSYGNNSNNTTLFVLAAGFVIVALAIMFAPSADINVSSDGSTTSTISVSGQAQFDVDPDQAEIYIRVQTEEPTANRAQEENARLMTTVMEALKKSGVADDEMETTNYNLWPQQKWDPDTREYEDTGFIAQHLLKVTTDDVTGVGNLLDVAVKNGANGLDRIEFTLSDKKRDDVNSEALAQASSSAKDKAEAIAQGLGVRLGDIKAVSESNVGYTPYARPMYAMAEMDSANAGGFKTSVAPESVTVSASISIAYEIK